MTYSFAQPLPLSVIVQCPVRLQAAETADVVGFDMAGAGRLPECPVTPDAFARRFSHRLAPAKHTDAVIGGAEYYGGLGTAFNRGAGRVVNLGGWQIKGIGPTPLVDWRSGFLHAYGALTAAEAAYELIFTRIANRLLPAGAAAMPGILLTSRDGAYYAHLNGPEGKDRNESFRCWGALAVRRVHVRPAHLLPLTFLPDGDKALSSDAGRVRLACRRLSAFHRGDARAVNMALAGVVDRAAAQFAGARACGLAHGAVSPSNLGFDGAWLDLARTTFVRRCENNGAFLGAADEHIAFVSILGELAYAIRKFCRLAVDLDTLTSFYRIRYTTYLHRYMARQACPAFERFDGAPEDALGDLSAFLIRQLANAGGVRDVGPGSARPSGDTVTTSLASFYRELAMHTGAGHKVPAARTFAGATLDEFTRQVERADGGRSAETGVALLRRTAASAMRRQLIRDFFVKKPLDDVLRRCATLDDPAALVRAVDMSLHVADWAFADDVGVVCLLDLEGWRVDYDSGRSRILMQRDGDRTDMTVTQALSWARAQADESFVRLHHDFRPYLVGLLDVLGAYEQAS